jgi:hypothetical protein
MDAKSSAGRMSASTINLGRQKNAERIHSEQWKDAAGAFVKYCSRSTDSHFFEILNSRGIKEDTAREFRLGWHPIDEYISGREWGLPIANIWIPAGLVIPIFRDERVVRIKIRCSAPRSQARYIQLRGSANSCLFTFKNALPIVVVESELDAILIEQEAGDLVGSLALGGTNQTFDHDAITYLSEAQRILVATDFDDQKTAKDMGAGQKAFIRLKLKLPRAEYFPPAIGKDPTESQIAGVSIRSWVEAGISIQDVKDK